MRTLSLPTVILPALLAITPFALSAQGTSAPAKPTTAKLAATPKTATASKSEEHGPVNWVTLEQAMDMAKRDGKPVMVDVFTQWCGPCKMLSSKTFTDKQLADYVNKNFHAVRFDAEGNGDVTFKGQKYSNPEFRPENTGMRNGTHQLTMQLAPVNGRVAYPTVVYMDAEGTILAPVQGYLTPEQMEPILIYFGEGVYKKQDYQTFQSGFTTRRTVE